MISQLKLKLEEKKQNLSRFNKKARMGNMTSMGIELALGAIFLLGIGIQVTQDVTTAINATGILDTVLTYAPVVLGAAFLFFIAIKSGMVRKV